MENTIDLIVPEEVILDKILLLRGIKVLVDRDIAKLYGITTKVLNQSVKRNLKRFPEDFMFQMTVEKFENWKSQFVTSNSDKMGLRKLPNVFSEQGVAMLAGIIKSDIAISVSIQIIRAFVKLRKLLLNNEEIMQKIDEIQKKDTDQDNSILLIFEYLKQLEQDRQLQSDYLDRRTIGFKIGELE